MPDREDDVTLVRRLVENDTDALRVLYDRYGSIVFGMAMRVLEDRQAAEECTQDAFVAIWRSAGTYDPERGGVTSWLVTIARNRAVDLIRRRAARPAIPRAEIWQSDEAPDVAYVAAAAEHSQRVAEALAELPAGQRDVLFLAYFQGLSHSEIAERLSIPLGTVKSRTRLALDRLRELAPKYALHAEREA